MRLKYYMITLRQMNLKKSFVFLAILSIFIISIFTMLYKNVKPALEFLCNANAKSIALKSTEKVVNQYIGTINYEDLVNIQKNKDGTVQSINANVITMNKLASDIVANIQTELESRHFGNITVPIGSIMGTKFFGGYGPKIKIKTITTGSISVEFKSSFDSAGVNQTRHRIVAQITTYARTISPIRTDTQEYVNDLTVAETIIIGNVPSTYYNITGIEDLGKKEVLDILE